MSDGNYNAKIVTRQQHLFEGAVQEVLLPAHDGERGVLPGHENFIGSLGTGTLKIVDKDGASEEIIVSKGVYQIKQGSLLILAQRGWQKSDVNTVEAKETMERLEPLLVSENGYTPEYEQIREDYDIARAQIDW